MTTKSNVNRRASLQISLHDLRKANGLLYLRERRKRNLPNPITVGDDIYWVAARDKPKSSFETRLVKCMNLPHATKDVFCIRS